MISLNSCDDLSLLSLKFERGLRENAILWMLGTYLEIVETEVISRGNKITASTLSGIFKQRKLTTRNMALPEIGIILGVDVDAEGIG